jgi:dGTPase
MAARKAVNREDRLFTEGPQETRTPFERDRDRVLYSDAFRRLGSITQVVMAGEGRFFHNRLTHSLKVAQFGRRTAQILKQRDSSLAIDADVVETACLIHDIGHPPFGHAAEEELNTLLKDAGGFEGNAQSFRVITELSLRRRGERGLNLTRATLNASLKYPWAKRDDKKGGKKWGYYQVDARAFRFARQLTKGDDRCLEAEIMDWADDVTYAVHDLSDHYRAGMIPLDQLLHGGPARQRFLDSRRPEEREPAETFFENLGKTRTFEELHRPFDGSEDQRAALSWFSSQMINELILQPTVKREHLDIPEHAGFKVAQLKGLMEEFIFNHPALAAQQYGQRRVIKELFEIFSKNADGEGTMGIIPREYRHLFKPGKSNEDNRARHVGDLIAGLTEREALHHYQRLTGSVPGTVLDSIWY